MLPPPRRNEGPLPEFLPAIGRRRATVALFTGCIGDAMFRHVNWATARVLQQNGCDVHVPQTQVCCGAIHFHAGSSEPAQKFADDNLAAFPIERFDAIINNIAGCGSMLKDYGHHWHDGRQSERAAWAAKVRDVNEFLDQLGPVRPEGEIQAVATYHDACHLLHAQKIHDAPRRLLAHDPGPRTARSAGVGTLLRRRRHVQPDAAGDVGPPEPAEDGEHQARPAPRVAITSNAGCALQIAGEARKQGERLAVVHPMEVLDWSYRGVKPKW